MQHFYDGQIRRYLTQTIRVFSNFVVKYADGTLVRIPVMYGDQDRQVASIIRNNSENKVSSVPRIAVYITSLSLDRERLSDATFVSKVHVREREVDDTVAPKAYTQGQGRNYTIERIMPNPFKLTMKIDIWAANTDQKLQILEQILILFNPSLELQTTDNYVDWTSLTVLNLNDIAWSSKQVPVGNDTPIDIASLTVDTPIWLSPPVKVKHLGVITKIVASLWEGSNSAPGQYIDGLGVDMTGPTTSFSTLLSEDITTITNYHIQVYNNQAILLGPTENAIPYEPTLEIPVRQGSSINWRELLEKYPGKFVDGSSQIYLLQPNGSEIVGTVAINPLDETILTITWDADTLTSNTGIDSDGYLDTDPSYGDNLYRTNSPGTFDAIINPQTTGPNDPKFITRYGSLEAGRRYLIIEDIGSEINVDGADAWKSLGGDDLIARANDIIEWTGESWNVIFDSNQESDTMVWQTNIYTNIQYLWNGVSWIKSFEGDYRVGQWRLEL